MAVADQDLLQLMLILVEAVQAGQVAEEQITVIVLHMADIILKVGDLAHKAMVVDQAEQALADLHSQIKATVAVVVAVAVLAHRVIMEQLDQIHRLMLRGLV